MLLAGAALTGWLGAVLAGALVRRTRLHEDAALALLLAVFFGFGLVLLTQIQKHPQAAQAGLDAFLFGQAAAMLDRDVRTIAWLGGAALVAVWVLRRAWKLVSFDPDYARTLGWPVRALEIGLVSALIVAVVLGLQSVGVVLMSALLVAPAAAARQWTQRFAPMLLLSGGFGAAAGFSGTLLGPPAACRPGRRSSSRRRCSSCCRSPSARPAGSSGPGCVGEAAGGTFGWNGCCGRSTTSVRATAIRRAPCRRACSRPRT